ncbi:unnamed protein product [Pleuronectes platessa]|uniref:Uncharacterized protein n=1 Tax=Pleuronectes platessa TaxID=8262 RepID=A0A9N7YUR5_PLEPL|nr:unnamed protein product [Pleuronectes platessa]
MKWSSSPDGCRDRSQPELTVVQPTHYQTEPSHQQPTAPELSRLSVDASSLQPGKQITPAQSHLTGEDSMSLDRTIFRDQISLWLSPSEWAGSERMQPQSVGCRPLCGT